VPVPQTDTGRRGENPKVIERTLVKELGKMTPNFGRRGALLGCKPERATVNRPRRLFSKNSRYPLACAPQSCLRKTEALFSRSYEGNLPSSFSVLLSSALVFSTSPPVSVWGTVSWESSFLEPVTLPAQSNKSEQNFRSVTSPWPTNIDVVPIGYAVSASP